MAEESFGCQHCWPPAADEAETARRSLTKVADLVAESHFSIRVFVCDACSQHFLSVFTETVDWDGGEDPMYWTTVPLRLNEWAALQLVGSSPEAFIRSFDPNRRCLKYDFPKGQPASNYWGHGIVIRPHD